MNTETLFSINTIHRDNINVKAAAFGGGRRRLAIVGSLRGNEIQQMFIASRLVYELTRLEAQGAIKADNRVLVIPCVNNFSMNLGKRFWAVDNTDINKMFPGYAWGETTQRVANSLFEALKGYEYGIQFTSFYMSGEFVPHIRVIETEYNDIAAAAAFGLPFVMTSKPKPTDTGTLNYNWQIFNTKAYSLYTKQTDAIDLRSAKLAVCSVMSFMRSLGIIDADTYEPSVDVTSASDTREYNPREPFDNLREPFAPDCEYNLREPFAPDTREPLTPDTREALTRNPVFFSECDLVNVTSGRGGIFLPMSGTGYSISAGGLLAVIIDPYSGEIIENLLAPTDGTVFFSHSGNLISQHDTAFRLLRG